MRTVTEKQLDFLATVDFIVNDKQETLTFKKIGEMMRISSRQNIERYIRSLKKQKLINYVPGEPMKLNITQKGYEYIN